MDKQDTVTYLVSYFLKEMPDFMDLFNAGNYSYPYQRKTLRGLLNVRRPSPLPVDISEKLDILLRTEREEINVVGISKLPATNFSKIGFYAGDITRLAVDAIVNPATPAMLGCFVPGHNCIDNRIHSLAGPRLREDCDQIIKAIGHEEVPGRTHITRGYNLLAKYVIHTVGPTFRNRPSTKDKNDLANCYVSALKRCITNKVKTVAFPAISVGENGFISSVAAQIAISTVEDFISEHPEAPVVVFCMEKESDIAAYDALLND
ncbi:MAG: macro domain-containing protein [Bacilli bacterium]|nr:macro domain-containing protein [Bacilli bacterium]